MSVEFEMKYRASAELLDQIQAQLPGHYTLTQMTTSYYDTPDGDLAKLFWTLRHRQEGSIHICTLKTPALSGGRNEFEWQCEHIADAVPHLSRLSESNALSVLAQKGLVQTCGARFTRATRLLHAGSTTVELALDRGVLIGGGRELAFAELEVELKEGFPEECKIIGYLLASTFGLEPEPRSKFARAKELGGMK